MRGGNQRGLAKCNRPASCRALAWSATALCVKLSLSLRSRAVRDKSKFNSGPAFLQLQAPASKRTLGAHYAVSSNTATPVSSFPIASCKTTGLCVHYSAIAMVGGIVAGRCRSIKRHASIDDALGKVKEQAEGVQSTLSATAEAPEKILKTAQERVSSTVKVLTSDDGRVLDETIASGTVGAIAISLAVLPYVPVSLYSSFLVLTTGYGLPAGPSGFFGAAEGLASLVVFFMALWSLISVVTRARGLPAGPFSVLGITQFLCNTSALFLLGVSYLNGGDNLNPLKNNHFAFLRPATPTTATTKTAPKVPPIKSSGLDKQIETTQKGVSASIEDTKKGLATSATNLQKDLAKSIERTLADTSKSASSLAQDAQSKAAKALAEAQSKAAVTTQSQFEVMKKNVADQAGKVADKAESVAQKVSEKTEAVAQKVAEKTEAVADKAGAVVQKVTEKAGAVAQKVADATATAKTDAGKVPGP